MLFCRISIWIYVSGEQFQYSPRNVFQTLWITRAQRSALVRNLNYLVTGDRCQRNKPWQFATPLCTTHPREPTYSTWTGAALDYRSDQTTPLKLTIWQLRLCRRWSTAYFMSVRRWTLGMIAYRESLGKPTEPQSRSTYNDGDRKRNASFKRFIGRRWPAVHADAFANDRCL